MISFMSKEVNVIGAGGNCRPVIELLKTLRYSPQGVYDESYDPKSNEIIVGCPLKGELSSVPEAAVVIAVGDNAKRKALAAAYSQQQIRENLIHPKSVIEESAKVGRSNILMAMSYLSAMVVVGDNNLINSGAIIEHETVVGNHCHISVGAVLCGRVRIGDLCFIGAGSVVKDGVSICDNVTVGAGSVVIKNVTEPGVYVGNPARRVK